MEITPGRLQMTTLERLMAAGYFCLAAILLTIGFYGFWILFWMATSRLPHFGL
jgi:hypothetical protein